jgi:hypothetical protein
LYGLPDEEVHQNGESVRVTRRTAPISHMQMGGTPGATTMTNRLI